jgi:hypothetical protein
MKALGWVFLILVWSGILTAFTYCLSRVMRIRDLDHKSRKGHTQSD